MPSAAPPVQPSEPAPLTHAQVYKWTDERGVVNYSNSKNEAEATAEAEDGRLRTVRERMEEHRQNEPCHSCHQLMDPIGLSLENYDAIGQWRTREKVPAGTGAAKVSTVMVRPNTSASRMNSCRDSSLKSPQRLR